MNSNGSEFALRVALCDVIERLKRSEQKSLYLEKCRNQLIKEVMRLRVENEWLSASRQQIINDSNNKSIHSNNIKHNNCISSFNNNELKDENKTRIEYNIVGDNAENRVVSNADESWEEITVRLIRDLKRDVANGQLLSPELRYCLETCDESNQKDSKCGNAMNDKIESNALNYQRTDRQLNDKHKPVISSCNNSVGNSVDNSVHPINDSINEFNDKLLDRNVITTNNTQQQTNLCGFDDYNNSYSSQMCDKKKIKIFNNVDDRECDAQEYEMRKNTYSNLFESNPMVNNNSECINAFCSAIYYVKKDLNDVLQALTAQNEKLNRLKAKQLRSFFQRQINFDQTIHSTINTMNQKIDH